ncbi:DNA methyltransferase [Erwinia phage MIF8]
MKSFLTWPGGKFTQLAQILPVLPKAERLIEPFVGGGSVFLNAGIQSVMINDVNPDLTNLYNVIKHHGTKFIDDAEMLCKAITSKTMYDSLRERFNTREYSNYSMAVFFLVLNRTCFNGMCRYIQSREFNVPWGKDPEVYFPRAELESFMASVHKLEIFSTDFASVMMLARAGDVVFCDPPYEPMPGKEGFTTYSGKKFTFADQVRLVEAAVKIKPRGVSTVITNSSAPSIIKLYEDNGFKIQPLIARRSVAAKAESRGNVEDIIAIL